MKKFIAVLLCVATILCCCAFTAHPSKDIQDTLTAELPAGVTLPYLYLGTVNPTASVETYNNGKKISIIGGNWDDDVITLAEKYATDAKSQFTVGTTSETFYGYVLLEDKTAVRMQISENYL